MNVDELRSLIAYLEPLMGTGSFVGSFVELEDEARKLVDHVEETFTSDISSYEGLLLAALVSRLRLDLREQEKRLKAKV